MVEAEDGIKVCVLLGLVLCDGGRDGAEDGSRDLVREAIADGHGVSHGTNESALFWTVGTADDRLDDRNVPFFLGCINDY